MSPAFIGVTAADLPAAATAALSMGKAPFFSLGAVEGANTASLNVTSSEVTLRTGPSKSSKAESVTSAAISPNPDGSYSATRRCR